MEDVLRSYYENEDEDLELSAEEWKAKFHETMQKIKEASEQQQHRYSSIASPSRAMTQVGLGNTGTNSSTGNSNNKEGVVVTVNTAVDSRTFQIITLKRMNARNFEDMIPLLQPGRTKHQTLLRCSC